MITVTIRRDVPKIAEIAWAFENREGTTLRHSRLHIRVLGAPVTLCGVEVRDGEWSDGDGECKTCKKIADRMTDRGEVEWNG